MTISNIPKSIRRTLSCHAYVLIGYLPTTWLQKITNKAAQRCTIANLFHSRMCHAMSPLKEVGKTGRPMASGDGIIRHTHPILATFVGDYPKQLLATGIKTGQCPRCTTPHDSLGNHSSSTPPQL